MTTLLWLAMLPAPFVLPLDGELIAWSQILDDEEALCVVNGHGTQLRGGEVVVDAVLNKGNLAINISTRNPRTRAGAFLSRKAA